MTREEIIQGLQFTIDMFLLNPTTGETYTEPRNDMDKTTIDACKGAIKLLREESEKDEVILTKKEYGELVSSEFDNGYAKGFREALEQEPCEGAVSRKAVIEHICEGKDCYKKNCKGVLYNRCPDIEWVNELPTVTPQEPILDKIRAEIKGWQVDIHDNEYDADKHDFVFERIFEIIDEYKTESEE